MCNCCLTMVIQLEDQAVLVVRSRGNDEKSMVVVQQGLRGQGGRPKGFGRKG